MIIKLEYRSHRSGAALQPKENKGKCSTEEGATWKPKLLKAQLSLSGDCFYSCFSVLQKYCPGKDRA